MRRRQFDLRSVRRDRTLFHGVDSRAGDAHREPSLSPCQPTLERLHGEETSERKEIGRETVEGEQATQGAKDPRSSECASGAAEGGCEEDRPRQARGEEG